MCGIAGIINFNGQPVDRHDLEILNNALVHRGPDGEGIYCQENVGLAHRRLAIIDPQLGQQPFFSEDKSIVLSYNGEVYNYKEIYQELKKDFNFKTHSDTEVVLKAYQKWGIDCLERFRGMFAFAIYDKKKNLLYLVRDRVGIKPLYYYQGEQLIFASELTPLLKLPTIPREINAASLGNFFRYQYVPTPATIYNHIYKLEPGHFLEVDLNKKSQVKKQCYWNLRINIVEKTEQEWLDALNAELDETIRMYVRSDVPFGAFLSGGVDSSIVTAVMSQHLKEPVRTFSIGFQERKFSELPYAAEASDILQTHHFEKIVSSQLALDILNKITVHFGEPFADSSAIPTYYVAQQAAQQVKMVLSGDGGDELFAGYNTYPFAFRHYMHPPNPLLERLFITLRMLRYGVRGAIKTLMTWQPITLQQKHNKNMENFDEELLRQLLLPHFTVPERTIFHVDILNKSIDPITLFQAQDFKTYLLNDILTKVDRMSMANSLEVRVPLLDHKIVELAFSLPLNLKIRSDKTNKIITKYLLKQSASRFFSDKFLNRPKKGFGIPVVDWCRHPLRVAIEDGLRDSQNPIFDWIQFDYVQKLLNAFFKGSNAPVTKIWYIFMFDLWMKNVHLKK